MKAPLSLLRQPKFPIESSATGVLAVVRVTRYLLNAPHPLVSFVTPLMLKSRLCCRSNPEGWFSLIGIWWLLRKPESRWMLQWLSRAGPWFASFNLACSSSTQGRAKTYPRTIAAEEGFIE